MRDWADNARDGIGLPDLDDPPPFDDRDIIGTGNGNGKATANAIDPFPLKTYSGLPAPPRWLLGGLIEAGTCTILAAEPKCGKSWIAFDLGVAVATGGQVLGEWTPEHRGKTLYYSPEGGDRSRHARICGLCWGRDLDPEDVFPSMPFLDARLDMMAADHAERLGATIDATGAHLIIIDPMVSAAIGVDENSTEVMRILDPLRDLITARPECALIVAHHTNKSARTQALSLGLRGSSAIAGWWDTLISIRRADDDSSGPRRIDIAHRDAVAPDPVGWQLNHGPAECRSDLEWYRLARVDVPEIGKSGGVAKSSSGPSLDDDLLRKIEDQVRGGSGKFSRGRGADMIGETDRRRYNRHFASLVRDNVLGLDKNGKMIVAQTQGEIPL